MPGRVAATIRRNWQFSLMALVAVLMRVIVMAGYPPIMWFPDSYNYFEDAVTHVPDNVRPNGYPFFLDLFLEPFHGLYLVGVVQAAMGVAMGTLIYAVLRRRGLPWWGAMLPAVPVMFDVFELEIEHMITADVLFFFLVTLALVICCWKDRPSVTTMAIAGVLVGYAGLVRSVGEPLLVVFIIGMLVRRPGWRPMVALVVAGIVPIAAYMVWFHNSTGKYAITESSGTFLYGRVSAFAECSKMNPPADLKVLCDPTPPGDRQPSQEYIWAENERFGYRSQTTPLYNWLGTDNSKRFTPEVSGLAQKFAERAILAQPGDYLRVVVKDTLHTFGWNRQPDPGNFYGNGDQFRFTNNPWPLPWWAKHNTGDAQATKLNNLLNQYLGPRLGQPSVNKPWAGIMQWYQRWAFLPGSLLGVILLIGAAGVVGRWRRWGGLGLLPFAVGLLLIVLPPMTAGFSYRYVLAAAPAACLAAGLTFARRPGDQPARAWLADLGRYFGRSVPVNEE